MTALTIDLQDGFANDLVCVRVDGTEVFRRDGLTTSPLSGLAESIVTQVAADSVTVEVALPARGLARTIALSVAATAYLGISVRGDQIEPRPSSEPFYYM